MGFYLKRTVYRDTPADIAQRIAYRKAVEQANAETFAKYPTITAQNLEEVIRFKEARIEELCAH